MNAPHPIVKAFSSLAVIYHSVSLSESQLCFSGWVFPSTWHSSDVWKRDVSGMLFEILQPKKLPCSIRENLHLVRVVEQRHRLPTEAVERHPWAARSLAGLGGEQPAPADPARARGGTGAALEAPSSPNGSGFLWVSSNYHLLKLGIHRQINLKRKPKSEATFSLTTGMSF